MDDKKAKKDDIVPFGKYKGQPIERLIADQSYLDWLMAQDWFRQKFQNIYTVIINYNTQPSETPEHNKMQVRFLSVVYQLKLAYLLLGANLFKFDQKHFDAHILKFWDDVRESLGTYTVTGKFYDGRSRLKEYLETINGASFLEMEKVKFEHNNVDVYYEISYGYGKYFGETPEDIYFQAHQLFRKISSYETKLKLAIELKPTVGDDFPSVLRQMQKNKSSTLVLQEYTGTGATWDEFIEYFKSQNINVVVEHQIEQVVIPSYNESLIVPVEKFLIPEDQKRPDDKWTF